jgi:molybdopterin biosynthesis enzyme
MEAGTAVLSADIKPSKDRESYLPARLSTNEKAQLLAKPLKWGGSSDFVGFVRATALIIVPASAQRLDAGSVVTIVHLPQ